eukprot:GILJ01000594.1.p1 GENE.GILJ01000594.1~~GILJ01000594.1.p1  ORF type:complete len:353 (-),score=58.16 GILJ01000594.1:228-1214(-)
MVVFSFLSRTIVYGAVALLGYDTFKALRRREQALRGPELLLSWIVVALWVVTQDLVDLVLCWFPFYYETKTILFLWLVLPQTQGVSTLFRSLDRQLLEVENEVDTNLASFLCLVQTYMSTSLRVVYRALIRLVVSYVSADELNKLEEDTFGALREIRDERVRRLALQRDVTNHTIEEHEDEHVTESLSEQLVQGSLLTMVRDDGSSGSMMLFKLDRDTCSLIWCKQDTRNTQQTAVLADIVPVSLGHLRFKFVTVTDAIIEVKAGNSKTYHDWINGVRQLLHEHRLKQQGDDDFTVVDSDVDTPRSSLYPRHLSSHEYDSGAERTFDD